ncbi:MAG: nucleoside hydrolase [Actinomycetota bacterium]|nr:nucleoside hydrolase [Actinomycetota bacterium]
MTVPMIIDTDPGVDDAVALMLAAASSEVQLLAVTTVYGNVGLEVTTANALRLRAFAGLDHVPVAAGAARPLVDPQHQPAGFKHGVDGLGGRADLLPDPIGPIEARGAVALTRDLLQAAAAPVTLVAIGPLTNIALLLAAHPEVRPWIDRIVIMGGHFGGLPAESNIRADPEAARRVLMEEHVPITLVPLDLTQRAPVDGDWLAELAAAGPRCAALAGVITHYRHMRRIPVALHDSLAVLEAAVRGSLATTPMTLDVVCDHGPARGAVTVGDGGHGTDAREVRVAVDGDLPAINATILNRLRLLR